MCERRNSYGVLSCEEVLLESIKPGRVEMWTCSLRGIAGSMGIGRFEITTKAAQVGEAVSSFEIV